MKVTLKEAATSGKIRIEAGEYLVNARPDIVAIQLTGKAADYLLPAIRRPNRGESKITNVLFYSLGGGQWTIVVSIPKRGEFVAFVQYDTKTEKAEKKLHYDLGRIDLDKADKAELDKPSAPKFGKPRVKPVGGGSSGNKS